MKEFRGSLIALVLVFVVSFVYFGDSQESIVPIKVEQLFRFEKHDLKEVVITQPTGTTIQLQEREGVWYLNDESLASTSMVNRIKHQLHDLDARTTVVKDTKSPTRYGLGETATRVELFFRSRDPIRFLVGDPNPSLVSYYMQPLEGSAIYTVKKSSMD